METSTRFHVNSSSNVYVCSIRELQMPPSKNDVCCLVNVNLLLPAFKMRPLAVGGREEYLTALDAKIMGRTVAIRAASHNATQPSDLKLGDQCCSTKGLHSFFDKNLNCYFVSRANFDVFDINVLLGSSHAI
jgi:hypothetical protein